MKRKNRKFYVIVYLLLFLSILYIITSLVFLPDQVPLQYNFKGEIVRYGSKYFYLLYLLIIIALGLFLTFLANLQGRKQAYANEKAIIIADISTLIFLDALILYFINMSYRDLTSDVVNPVARIGSLAAIILGVLLFVLGLLMPRLTRNSVIGLRTTWSMYNDNVWKKSQQIGGLTMASGGLIIVVMAIFFQDYWPMVIAMVVLFIDLVISVLVSYLLYKKEITQNKNS
jgi:uncharacterized membrane protein